MRTDLYYKKNIKYQTAKEFVVHLPTIIKYVKKNIHTDFCSLTTTGCLTIFKRYGWDGPSGPTIDTETSMAGSLVHDLLYHLIRLGHLPIESKDECDNIMRAIMLQDGMWGFRAKYFLVGVSKYGKGSLIKPKKVHHIPAGTASKEQ